MYRRTKLVPMPTDIRSQMGTAFYKARDEYVAAIQAHSDALFAALETEAAEAEYEQATMNLDQKREAYRRATDDLRALTSRKSG